ncbi:MAG: hypothetical protein KA387_06985 [Rubrivivax sp.]|nr:hypothetical protein [Rubrivivax sp.]
MLCNTQSELHPLEEGKHAAESGMDLKAYAAASGKGYENLRVKSKAWRVLADSVHVYATGFEGTPEQQTEYLGKLVDTAHDSWRNLAEIHAAPQWLWPALVEKMTGEAWTVATTASSSLTSASNPLLPGDGRGIECLQSQSQALARHVDSLRLRQDAPSLQCTKVQSSEGFLFISC